MVDIKNSTTEGRNEYTYSASGQKLRAVQKWNPNYSTAPVIGSDVNVSAMTNSSTTDYVGNIIYENNTLKRILVDGGYYESGNYYFYVNDHLGNNRVVTNAAASVVQSTQYYPFGSSFADAMGGSVQPYKYNGKELDARNGLNMSDYGARWKPDWYFTTVDPLSEKYYSISPYAYCGNNPIIRTDPTGMAWFYYSLDGKSDPTWNWRDEDMYHTGVKDSKGKEVVLQGAEAVVVFNGSRSEKLGKGDKINGEGATTANVTVYGPDGADDIHNYTGFTMTSNAKKFGPIDEGIYDGYKTSNSGPFGSHLRLKDNIRMLDGKLNPNPAGSRQITSNGEGYKTGIFIHRVNNNGFAGEVPGSAISTGCLLIDSKDWQGFNNVMSGVKNFKVQVIRQVVYKTPLTNFIGQEIPGLYINKLFNKKD